MKLRLHNTLTRSVEPFVPERAGLVRMYTCGPTVYRAVHLGNLRSYLLSDWLRRTFELAGHRVMLAKNITDVGHMRQDAVDRGEDKVVAAALAEGKTPRQIADFYETAFHEDERRLGILPATYFPKATDHVPEMIAMIARLVERGLAYEVDGTLYFAVKKFAGYGHLSGNVGEALRQGTRAEVDPNKHHPADFALWKKGEPGRMLLWDSPWSPGFPGWHIECSAMSIKYLGETFDVHTGGVDNVFPHHEDEIAQSEGALGHVVVRHWVHGQHLLADGVKMAKSARNTLTVDEMEELGIDPLAFRYQCLLTHYRARMYFSLGALRQAARGLDHLRQRVRHWAQLAGTARDESARAAWRERIREAISDDLDLPGALALAQRCAADEGVPPRTRLDVLLEADKVLGLDLAAVASEREQAPPPVVAAVESHVAARRERDYTKADALRTRDGYRVEDKTGQAALLALAARRAPRRHRRTIASALELPDRRADTPTRSWTVAIVTRDWPADLERCVRAALAHLPAEGEVQIMDAASRDDAVERLAALASADGRVEAHYADRDLGEGASRNALLRAARGRLLLQLDPSVEITGDLYGALAEALRPGEVGLAGPWGLRTTDLKHYDEVTSGEVDAMQGYCAATRREVLLAVGGFDDRYRFYRNLDIAVSLAIRELGQRVVAVGETLARRHAHRVWESLAEDERLKRSRKNFDRLYKRFHGIAPVSR